MTFFTAHTVKTPMKKCENKNWKTPLRRPLYYQKWGCSTTLNSKNILSLFMKKLRYGTLHDLLQQTRKSKSYFEVLKIV